MLSICDDSQISIYIPARSINYRVVYPTAFLLPQIGYQMSISNLTTPKLSTEFHHPPHLPIGSSPYFPLLNKFFILFSPSFPKASPLACPLSSVFKIYPKFK